jgi:hypothetical protein
MANSQPRIVDDLPRLSPALRTCYIQRSTARIRNALDTF